MKAFAARTRDIDDLRLLADIVGVESADAALQICANFYPDEPVSPRSAAVLRNLSTDHSNFGHLAGPDAPPLNRRPRRAYGINQQRLSITPSGHRDLPRQHEIERCRKR
jgi:hypothetical protein